MSDVAVEVIRPEDTLGLGLGPWGVEMPPDRPHLGQQAFPKVPAFAPKPGTSESCLDRKSLPWSRAASSAPSFPATQGPTSFAKYHPLLPGNQERLASLLPGSGSQSPSSETASLPTSQLRPGHLHRRPSLPTRPVGGRGPVHTGRSSCHSGSSCRACAQRRHVSARGSSCGPCA